MGATVGAGVVGTVTGRVAVVVLVLVVAGGSVVPVVVVVAVVAVVTVVATMPGDVEPGVVDVDVAPASTAVGSEEHEESTATKDSTTSNRRIMRRTYPYRWNRLLGDRKAAAQPHRLQRGPVRSPS